MTIIEALEQRIAELEAKNTLQEQQLEQYEQAYATLKHQFQQSLRHCFGSRSERFIDPDHPQAGLFDTLLTNELADNQDEENLPDNMVTIASYQRKKKGRGKLNPDLPGNSVIINVPDEERMSPCGCEKVFMRYITTERYDYRPENVRWPKKNEKSWFALTKPVFHPLLQPLSLYILRQKSKPPMNF